MKYMVIITIMLTFSFSGRAEQIETIDPKKFEKIFELIDSDRVGTLNWCLTKTKMRADHCYERYGGKAGILFRLQTYCGATFQGADVAKIDELAKSANTGADMVEVSVDDLIKNLSSLKRNCDSVIRSGSFFLCKKSEKYDYLNSSFSKLTKQPCDQVVVDGKSAYCLKRGNGKYEVIESHISDGKGGATCTQTSIFNPDDSSKKSKGVR